MRSRNPGVNNRRRLHSVVFRDPQRAKHAVARLRAEGFTIHDVHTPFPVHGMEEAMGLPPTRLAWSTLAGGAAGVGLALSFQIWSHTSDWPLMIGGKDLLALPALVPVTFELGVLLAAFATVGTLLFRSRLFPRGDAPAQPRRDVSDDRFVVLVEEADARFSPARFESVTADLGPDEETRVWRTY